MSGAMLAPSLHAIAQDFGTSEEEAQIFLSIFVLAFAFGPMVLSPFTEVFGRRPVWILSSCFYILEHSRRFQWNPRSDDCEPCSLRH